MKRGEGCGDVYFYASKNCISQDIYTLNIINISSLNNDVIIK
ncbi:MAG: hypothetical protein Q7S33_04055 [Nanoarchaeota archaeon]|nr:hypothetical protein [Nanoarchaeota archaeon]